MSSSTFNSRSALKAYSLAVVLVVGTHIAFASIDGVWSELYRLSIPVRDDALRLEANLQVASGDEVNAPVLLIGSSQTREDFDVEYLNERFQGRNRFINMSVSGHASPIEMYMLTPRMIEKKPSLVIYMPFIGTLFSPYAYSTFDLYFDPNILPVIHTLYGSGELVDHADAIAWGYFGRISDLFRYRKTYQHMVDDAVRRWVNDSPPKQAQTFSYHKRKPASHFQEMIAKHKNHARYYVNPYTQIAQVTFHMMVQSLKEQNIPLLVIDGPTHPLIKHFYNPALDSVYEQFWSAAASTHGFSYLSANELPEFTDPDFNDFTHLNAEGRARFTTFVADYLQANAARLGLPED